MDKHSFRYTGSMPCTGEYRCVFCGFVDPEGHYRGERHFKTKYCKGESMVDFLAASAVKLLKTVTGKLDDRLTGAVLHLIENNIYLADVEEYIRDREPQERQFVMRASCIAGNKDMFDRCIALDMVPGIAELVDATKTRNMEFFHHVAGEAQFSIRDHWYDIKAGAPEGFAESYDAWEAEKCAQ